MKARGGALVDSDVQNKSMHSQPNLKKIFILLIVADVAIIAGASLWLGAPEAGGCACLTGLTLSSVSLWHNGSATFSLQNFGTVYYTINQAKVTGPGVENGLSVTLFSGNVVSYKSAFNLTVFFSSFLWHDGGRYEFVLTDFQANRQLIASIVA